MRNDGCCSFFAIAFSDKLSRAQASSYCCKEPPRPRRRGLADARATRPVPGYVPKQLTAAFIHASTSDQVHL